MGRGYRVRVAALVERARRARSSFLPPAEPPDRDRAVEYLRDGVGPTVALYREASEEDGSDRLSAVESRQLDRALNEWFELYAACYGEFLDTTVTVPEVTAELDDGQTLQVTARQVTGIPGSTVSRDHDTTGARLEPPRSDRR
ncbi:MAG: hypothetical protein ABEI98_10525 [Halorhabdus sp.]